MNAGAEKQVEPLLLLYVEDNPQDADLTREYLAEHAPEIRVEIASTGQACLRRLVEETFDVLLLDFRLPDMDGIEVLLAMLHAGQHVPVVMVTGMGDEELVVKALRLGAVDYVPKADNYRATLPAILRDAVGADRSNHADGTAIGNTLRRILYVEHVLMDIELTLEHFDVVARNFMVDVVHSCNEGLARLAQPHAYDLVLIDLRMPDMSGLEFVRESRRMRLPMPAFVIVTGQGDDEAAIATLRLGAADYVTKREGYLDRLVYVIEHAIANHQLVAVNRRLQEELRARVSAQFAARESERQFRTTFEQAAVGLAHVAPDGRFLRVNQRFCEIVGYSMQELLSGSFQDITFPEDLGRDLDHVQSLLHGKCSTYSMEKRYLTKGGKVVWVDLTVALVRAESGEPDYFISGIVEISARKQAELNLRIAATAFESQEGMVVTDAGHVIVRVNQSFIEITGYAAAEAVGHTPGMFQSSENDPSVFASMNEALLQTGRWEGEIRKRRKNGEEFPAWVMITAVRDDAGQTTHYVRTFTDISARKQAEVEINNLAYFDPLTQLPNRRLLRDRLKQAISSAARKSGSGALLLMDLDDFKTLNDTRGHDVGDLLLAQIAQRLLACVREGDTVARLGGDEFVVMLEDLSANSQLAASQAGSIGEKIMSGVCGNYQLGRFANRSTSSIGITLFGDGQLSIDELLKRADLALYRAKAAGRNTMRFFEPEMQAQVTASAALESDLRKALHEGQFLLFYQAQVDHSGQVTGAEALLRWQHPQRGIVAPAEFIPVTEVTGLILPLGEWVLETACRQLALWSGKPATAQLTMAVNVSARQFHDKHFVTQVLQVIERTGVDPEKLTFELTESLLLDDVEAVIKTMAELKTVGVCFSLDDFGTGYSSLSYLKRLPLDELKIDQGFVRNLLTDSHDSTIAKMVISLARSMGLAIIAEGVETQEQCDFLARHGCDDYQGYLFCRPLPADEFAQYLQRSPPSVVDAKRPPTPLQGGAR